MRAARGGKSKRGGTSTIGGGGSLFIKFPISICFALLTMSMLGFPSIEWIHRHGR